MHRDDDQESRGRAKVLDRRTVAKGSFLELTAEDVELPGGAVTTLEILRHPGAAAVVPITAEGEVVLVRQYRHAVEGRGSDGWLLEVPAGKLDPGESPEHCARREVAEEVGYEVGELTPLGAMVSSPGFTDERIHLFLGRSLRPCAQSLDDDEVLRVERLPFARAVEKAADGGIEDAKTIIALLRAQRALRGGGGA